MTTMKTQFYASYEERQNWSLPFFVTSYITQNPSSSKIYQKLVQTCKHFFVKNPIIVMQNLSYHNKWTTTRRKITLDMRGKTFKIWLTRYMEVKTFNLLATVIPKLYQCDAKFLYFVNQNISFIDFCFLTSSVEEIYLNNVTVRNKTGVIVEFEKLVEVLHKGKNIDFDADLVAGIVTYETVKELLKIPHFSKIENLTIYNIPEAFDLETFYGYMKKNKFTKFNLSFNDSISLEKENRIEEIVDEIITTKIYDFQPIIISFPGMDEEKYEKLVEINRYRYFMD